MLGLDARASLRPTHTDAQFYGHLVDTPFNEREIMRREDISTFWDRRLVIIVPPNMRDLRVSGYICTGGGGGRVFKLRNTKTGEIAHVLKVMMGIIQFHPDEGPHLVTDIRHRGVGSPTHIFYLTSRGAFSLTPELKSRCIAVVMPYVEGVRLGEKMDEIAKRPEHIFHFGLQLALAIYEFAGRNIQHGDLDSVNILVNDALVPTIVDFDGATRMQGVSFPDYKKFQQYLRDLISKSEDIKPVAKKFLLGALPLENFFNQVDAELPLRMIALMRACQDHLEAIKEGALPFAPEALLASVETHLREMRSC